MPAAGDEELCAVEDRRQLINYTFNLGRITLIQNISDIQTVGVEHYMDIHGGPIGSALGMVLLGFIGSHWLGYTPDYFKLISVGVMANIFGQLGDLSMSLIKREAGIKDYSHIFLTHGGMLDRFDSTLFIAPIVYLCVGAGTI